MTNLFHMSPHLSFDDVTYRRFGNPVTGCDFRLGKGFRGPKTPDLLHIGISDFCVPMVPATGFSLSTLLNRIVMVVLEGSKKKVRWILTCRGIAVVADQHSCRDFAKVDYPANSVCIPIFPENLDAPVALPAGCGAVPNPTFIRPSFAHSLPKEPFVLLGDLHQRFLSRFRVHSTELVRALQSVQRLLRPSFYQLGQFLTSPKIRHHDEARNFIRLLE